MLLKQELLEFPNTFQQNPVDDLKISPTLNSSLHFPSHQDHKIAPPSEQVSFSLDDITGDVDHIQSSLDNIRELMFDNLPDGTSIEDLFGEDNALLIPLLQAASNNDQTANLILENIQEQNAMTS
jgi:hypothetical protein